MYFCMNVERLCNVYVVCSAFVISRNICSRRTCKTCLALLDFATNWRTRMVSCVVMYVASKLDSACTVARWWYPFQPTYNCFPHGRQHDERYSRSRCAINAYAQYGKPLCVATGHILQVIKSSHQVCVTFWKQAQYK
jgi:hypothetical protein